MTVRVSLGETFAYSGRYRTQSQTQYRPAAMSGHWITPQRDELTADRVNVALRNDPNWQGQALVNLRPAYIAIRKGVFAEQPDILYKTNSFQPDFETAALTTNVVDVQKAASGWGHRRSLLNQLVGQEVGDVIDAIIGPIESVAADEYMVHEAGHSVGISTEYKYERGYFKIAGKTTWPLVYVEEFKADLISFKFAADLLPPSRAASVFLYNIFLRMGMHLEAVERSQVAPYASIPFFLFRQLARSGWLRTGVGTNHPIEFASVDTSVIVDVMRQCSHDVRRELLDPESTCTSFADLALIAAGYLRGAFADETVLQSWQALMQSCQSNRQS